MAVQGFSSFSSDAVTYIAEKTLKIAERQVVFQQLGDKAVLPSHNSKTFQYTRYDRLDLPLVALSDGVSPGDSPVSISTVTAVADQWGAFVNISDVAELTVKHPVLQKAIDLMGYQAAELVDKEIINVLLAGTQVYFGGAITVRSSLATVSTDSMSTSVARRVVAGLRTLGAHEYDGQNFMGVVDAAVEQDLNADTSFLNASSYSNIKVLQNGEIGKWMGVRWMRSNLIPRLAGIAVMTTPTFGATGTFANATYRVSVAYYNKKTGLLEKITANSGFATGGATTKMTFTAPSDANFKYKVFVGLASGAAADIMYQGVATTQGTALIEPSAAVEVLAPPLAGESLAGSNIPGSGKTVHFSWVIGKEAYTVIDLQKLQTFLTPAQASDSDPLVQRRKAGWKLMFKSVINNQDFIARAETLSAFS